jgi:hypothetical protein
MMALLIRARGRYDNESNGVAVLGTQPRTLENSNG